MALSPRTLLRVTAVRNLNPVSKKLHVIRPVYIFEVRCMLNFIEKIFWSKVSPAAVEYVA
jgi:hypothetical protein